MNRNLIICILFYHALPVSGQQDSVWNKNLKEVIIQKYRIEHYNLGSRTDQPDSLLKRFFISSPIAGLLDASSGLVVRSYGPGVLATSSLRGGNAQQTSLSWNGVSINSPVNGLCDLNLVPSFLFDGVSVLPGIAGSLQGSGAISGGINLNSNQALTKGLSMELFQSVGSFGTFTGGLKMNFSKNNWSHTTKGFYTHFNNNYPFINYTEAGNPKQLLSNAKGQNYSVMHETGYNSKKIGRIKISYWGIFAQRQIPPTLLMQSSDSMQFHNNHKTMLQWDKPFKNVILKFRSVWQQDYLRYNDSPLDINSISKSIFITNDAELRFKLFKTFGTSIGIVQTYAKANVANVLTTETSIYNHSQRNQIAFWVSHFQELPVLRTRISASIRQEIVDSKPLPIMPSLGFKTHLNKNLDILGQTSRIYRIPTLNDLHWIPGGNPELRPESGWSFELGSEFHKKTEKVDFITSATAYSRLIANWIQWQPLNPQIWSPVNIGKVNSRGIEFRSTLKFILTKKIYTKTNFNFDYTKSENVDATNANYQKQLAYIPFYKLSGFIGFGYVNTFIMLNGIWVGKRFTTSDNSDFIAKYGLLNIAINQNLMIKKNNASVFFRINNILNKSYQPVVWRPMPGINFELGITLKMERR